MHKLNAQILLRFNAALFFIKNKNKKIKKISFFIYFTANINDKVTDCVMGLIQLTSTLYIICKVEVRNQTHHLFKLQKWISILNKKKVIDCYKWV